MTTELSPPEIAAALESRDFAVVRKTIAKLYPTDVADVIEELDEEQRAILFRLLPKDRAADTFEHLTAETQEGLLKALGRGQVAAILNDMSPDDRTALLEELPAAVTRQLLALLSPDERKIAVQLLGYPEDSVGRLMTPYVLAVGPDWTVQQALDHIRRHGEDSETINVISVVDDQGRLIDDLRIRRLLLADPDVRISELADGNFVALKATDDQEEAVRVFSEYDRVAFPVIDSGGSLLGIVTVDDVLDVAEEEATEDIQKIGGMEALDQPYMQASFATLFRKRAIWLVLLFLGQLLTLNAINHFSDQIAQAIFLIVFVPLVISSGGNSGSQAATLVVRAMALDEVNLGDWWKVLRREIFFGLTLGLILAAIGAGRIWLGSNLGESFGESWGVVAIIVGSSLIGVVIWGVLIGSMLPFILRRLGADPATSSTPFVATIVDVTGLIFYLAVATFILAR
jgi:magnesium transporter